MNKRIKVIENVLWICAIISMLGVVMITKELSKDIKDIKTELILQRK